MLHIFADMGKIVDIICSRCGKTGQKPLCEVVRNKRLGRENFCSRTCAGKSHTGKVRATKQCSNCTKMYKPSSRHSMCPSCRAEAAKKPCPVCSMVLIKAKSKACKECSLKDRPKKERNDKFYMTEVYNRVRLRCRTNSKRSSDVDVDYLLQVWNTQQKRCFYTGILLTLPTPERGSRITTASLDRIDSEKGYVKGNVQFVSMAINFMKNNMSHDETLQLVQLIKNSK